MEHFYRNLSFGNLMKMGIYIPAPMEKPKVFAIPRFAIACDLSVASVAYEISVLEIANTPTTNKQAPI